MTGSFQKKGRYSSYAPAAEFPHPKLEPEVFIILHQVLVRALEILSAEGQPLATMHEDPITSALQRVIENRLRWTGEVSGFRAPFFERVTRQHECDSFDGSRQRERPDLFFGIRPDDTFRARIQSDQWGVFAECKPVDADHFAGSDYCEEGLARFIEGNYALGHAGCLDGGVCARRKGDCVSPGSSDGLAGASESPRCLGRAFWGRMRLRGVSRGTSHQYPHTPVRVERGKGAGLPDHHLSLLASLWEPCCVRGPSGHP